MVMQLYNLFCRLKIKESEEINFKEYKQIYKNINRTKQIKGDKAIWEI